MKTNVGKESACNAGDLSLILGWGRSPWTMRWQPTPVFLLGGSHGQRSLVGYSPWDTKSQTRLSNFTLLTSLTSYFITREGNGNPLQCSCLEDPMDREAWRGPWSMGSQGVGHNWGDWAHTWKPDYQRQAAESSDEGNLVSLRSDWRDKKQRSHSHVFLSWAYFPGYSWEEHDTHGTLVEATA